MKFYLVDLALRNAVLRIGDELFGDHGMLGLYAENLVFNALRKWDGVLSLDYFRDRDREVDFVVHPRGSHYLPIEVKYRNEVSEKDLRGLKYFVEKYQCYSPLVITKKLYDPSQATREGCVFLPLTRFLLMMD